MAKRKRAKLIIKEGSFQLGYLDRKNQTLIELWRHNGFYYKLTKKGKIKCDFTEYKEFIPIISNWLNNINDIYRESRLQTNIQKLLEVTK